MGTESIQVSGVINASADQIYDAWLDAQQHSKFTGGAATVEPGIGGKFSAWDGYIQGTTLELEYGRRIVQAWRTTEFPAGSPDSRLEVVLEPIGDATRVTLRHSEIPEGQGGRYEQGWKEHYLNRMTKFFGDEGDGAAEESAESAAPAPPVLPALDEMPEPKPKAEKAPPKQAASPKKAAPAPKAAPKKAKPAKAALAKKKPAKKAKKSKKAKAKKKSSSKSAKKKSGKKSSKKAKKLKRSKKRR